ncbi:MAG: hypothetical protein SGPRY_007763, partial [Prymnesium sp.]
LHILLPELCAAALSVLGDMMIIATFSLSPPTRKVVALRLIVPLAVANLLGSLLFFLLVGVQQAGGTSPSFCAVTASLLFYFMWAAWLWNLPYAHFVWHISLEREATIPTFELASPALVHGLDGKAEREWARRREGAVHALCWGIPSVLTLLLFSGMGEDDYFSQDKGSSPPPFSRFTEEQQLSFQIGASVALWLGLGYNLVAFFSAYTSIKRSRELIQDFHTDFSTRRHLATRLTVWPRFVAFVVTYLVSSVPVAIYDSLNLLQTLSTPHDLGAWLSALALLHGAFNMVPASPTSTHTKRCPNQIALLCYCYC